ncbi:MAG: hypothetical protein AAGF19_09170 [Pseudomonadota bacterium]
MQSNEPDLEAGGPLTAMDIALRAVVVVLGVLILVFIGLIILTIFRNDDEPDPAPISEERVLEAPAEGGSARVVPLPRPDLANRVEAPFTVPTFGDLAIEIPGGGRIHSVDRVGSTLIIRLEGEAVSQLTFFDLSAGEISGTLRIGDEVEGRDLKGETE